MAWKVGDFCFTTFYAGGVDIRGPDKPGPRLRVVVEVQQKYVVCKTVEGGMPLIFRKDDLRAAGAKIELDAYRPVEFHLGFEIGDD